jgi:ABC-type phosphate/phosphonate transport system ATPase subunit
MSLEAAQRSSPYVRTFFNLFPRSQHQQVLETLLILGIQTAQHGSKKPRLADLQGLVKVNAGI